MSSHFTIMCHWSMMSINISQWDSRGSSNCCCLALLEIVITHILNAASSVNHFIYLHRWRRFSVQTNRIFTLDSFPFCMTKKNVNDEKSCSKSALECIWHDFYDDLCTIDLIYYPPLLHHIIVFICIWFLYLSLSNISCTFQW